MAYRDDTEAHQRYHEMLQEVRPASACNARWVDMCGSDKARRCLDCQRTVYDLNAMRAQEAVAHLGEEHHALPMYRRGDGTVIVGDCPKGVTSKLTRRAVALSTVIVMSTALAPDTTPSVELVYRSQLQHTAFAAHAPRGASGDGGDHAEPTIDLRDESHADAELTPPRQTSLQTRPPTRPPTRPEPLPSR